MKHVVFVMSSVAVVYYYQLGVSNNRTVIVWNLYNNATYKATTLPA
jgi:hypothetical protein